MKCVHCDGILKEKKKENKSEFPLFQCPKCKCYYRLILSNWDNKCYRKVHGT